MKIIKLSEESSDIKKRINIGKIYSTPGEAYNNSKNLKELDNAVAWQINITTGNLDPIKDMLGKDSYLGKEESFKGKGDDLLKVLPPGTLTEFASSIGWDELTNKNNLFMKVLSKVKPDEINKFFSNNSIKDKPYDKFITIYNGYVDGLYNLNDIEHALNEGNSWNTAKINSGRKHTNQIKSNRGNNSGEDIKSPDSKNMNTDLLTTLYNKCKNLPLTKDKLPTQDKDEYYDIPDDILDKIQKLGNDNNGTDKLRNAFYNLEGKDQKSLINSLKKLSDGLDEN